MATINYTVNAINNASAVFAKIGLSADKLDSQLSDLSKRIATPEVDLNDSKFTLGIVNAAKRLDKLNAMIADPEANLEATKLFTEVVRINAALDRLGKKRTTVTVDMDVNGLQPTLDAMKAVQNASNLRQEVERFMFEGSGGAPGSFPGSRGPGLFSRFISGFGGASGGGNWFTSFLRKLGGGFGNLPLGAQIPLGGAGAGVAGGVGLAATGIVSSLIEALVPTALGLGVGGAGVAGVAGVRPGAFSRLMKQVQQTFYGAVGQNQALGQGAFLKGPGGITGQGPTGVTNTFLVGVLGILKQVQGFIPTLGPDLQNLFKAALPYIQMFVKFGEQAAKIMLPAITQVLKEMQPFLPVIGQGLVAIVQGFAGFLKALGPQGMKVGAEVFLAAAKIIEGILIGLGKLIDWLAKAFGFQVKIIAAVWDWLSTHLSGVVKALVGGWDIFRHDTADVFDFIRHYLASWWDYVYRNTFVFVIRVATTDIPQAFDSARKFLEAWALRLAIIFAGWAKNIVHAAADAFGWVPGIGGKLKAADAAIGAFVAGTQAKLHQLTDKQYALTFSLNLPSGVSYPSRPIKGRASGGGVSRGEWAMVGERGPELAYFAGGGHVIPNHAIKGYAGGSGAVTVHLSLPSLQAMGSMLGGVVRAIVSHVQSTAHGTFSFAGGGGRTSAGGPYNLGMLESLWQQAGGPGGYIAHIAAAIALAESSGSPIARNPSGASGLWQILGQVVPGNIFNPFVNALNAVSKFDSAHGFSPWVTYETGAYRAFMDRGGWLMPGKTVVTNNTGRPERVLPPGGMGQPVQVNVNISATGADRALLEWLRNAVTVEGGGDVQVALGSRY